MKLLSRSAVASVIASVGTAAWLSCGNPSPVATPPDTLAPPPTTLPADEPVGTSCALGKGRVDAPCAKTAPRLLASVERAIDALVRHRPELFDTREEAAPNTRQYRVLAVDAYLDGVIDELRASGHCAERALDREQIVVKNTDSFSEEWDVLTSSRFIRRGGGAYQGTCSPASFPVEPADYIAYVRTHLWGYECFTPGVTPPAPGERKIPVGCDGRVTATPKLHDGRDVPSWLHGPLVEWDQREGHDVVRLDVDPRFPDNPFDKVLITSGKIGSFYVCATVLGKTGCLSGQTIP